MNGERLRQARQHAKLTQTAVGESVGLSQSMIGAMERGERNASFDIARQLANTLGVDYRWLLDEISETDPETLAADPSTPPGLRQLAADRVLIAALDIQPEEWRALRSLDLSRPINRDGYCALLFTLRMIDGKGMPASETTNEK